ncbi:autotransporter assembly complex protein TamB [secondary endosymbiont of Heteropsylla cubana]|nr:translocation/assembly module TamB domain-containing protein [secondary endosymbiont of Heteropsylla cubana]
MTFSVLVYLISTTDGLHLLINGVKKWVPGLEIGSFSGNWRNLTIQQLRYQMPGITLFAEKCHLKLNSSYFRQNKLSINNLLLEDVIVNLDMKKINSLTFSHIHNKKILSIIKQVPLERLIIKNIQVHTDNIHFALKKITTGLSFEDKKLIVHPTHISSFLITIPPTIQAFLKKSFLNDFIRNNIYNKENKYKLQKLALHSKETLSEKLNACFSKPLLSSLPSFTLPCNIILENIDIENIFLIRESSDLTINQLRIQGNIYDQNAELTLLNIDSSLGLISASGHISLKGQWPVTITLKVALKNLDLVDEKIKLTINGNLRDELHAEITLSGPLTAHVSLKAQLMKIGTPFILTCSSQSLQWPLIGNAEHQLHNLKLDLAGKPQNYRFALTAAFSGKNLPTTNIRMHATGNTNSFELSNLNISSLLGEIDLSIAINWLHTFKWHSKILFSGINPNHQWPNWPEKIGGKITSKGIINNDRWKLAFPELELYTQTPHHMLTLKGSIQTNSDNHWKIPQLILLTETNKLIITGKLSHEFSLNTIFDAPLLHSYFPGLEGQLRGNIRLRGNIQSPQLLINIKANTLKFKQFSLSHIVLNGSFLLNDIFQGNLNLAMDQLKHGTTLLISKFILNAFGNEKQHTLKIAINTEYLADQFQLKGSFDRKSGYWSSTINHNCFNVHLCKSPLQRSITLDHLTDNQNLIVRPHCFLHNMHVQLYIGNNINILNKKHTIDILDHFDFPILKSLIFFNTKIKILFNYLTNRNWSQGRNISKHEFAITKNSTSFSDATNNKILSVLSCKSLIFYTSLDKQKTRLNWCLKIHNQGLLNGYIQLTELYRNQRLSGKINIKNLSLTIFNPLLSSHENITGLINATLQLGGNLNIPQLYGKLKLKHFVIKRNTIPFSMIDSQLLLEFNGNSSDLKGVISTNHGQIKLIGTANWQTMEDWYMRVHAQGKRIRITPLPTTYLDISPDLIFHIKQKVFHCKGKIDIPCGHIKMLDIKKNEISISKDQVLLDKNLQPLLNTTNTSLIPNNLNLVIHLGQDVNLDAFGLKSVLTGNLHIKKDIEEIGVNGCIDIPSGRFHAYGQDFIVNKGQLVFSGPLTQPYLNIEAIRNPDFTEDNITVGIKVSGVVDQLKIKVFTQPLTSHQEALSYLLLGQKINSPGSDSNIITSILISMGIMKGAKIINKVGKTLGVNNLEIDTQGFGNNTQLVVRGYLSPRLQIKYDIGIFDSLTTLTFRYCLISKLYLEALSGINQAINLLCKFEF